MSRRKASLVLALAVVLAWRIAARPYVAWRDVPAILLVVALVSLAGRGREATLPAAAYLLGLYFASHAPRLLEILR